MNAVFISPHDDDHALFGAFTCLREKPILVVVFDGYVQANRGLSVTADQRKIETERAATLLDCQGIVRLGFRDDDPTVTAQQIQERASRVLQSAGAIFSPAWEDKGHHQHNLVAEAFGRRAYAHYLTYTSAGKTVHGRPVEVLEGNWIYRKLMALSRYESQFNLDPRMNCWQHFLRSQEEYYLL